MGVTENSFVIVRSFEYSTSPHDYREEKEDYYTSEDGGRTWMYNGSYTSHDGGYTWGFSGPGRDWERDLILWGDDTAQTPRGVFYIHESGVSLETASHTKVAYSTEHLKFPGNETQQRLSTRRLGTRELASAPRGILYDEDSGNVIVALGIQGVIVGYSDGNWERIAVGAYKPTDFSFGAKLSTAFGEPAFWPTAVSISIALVAAALMFSRDHSYARWFLVFLATAVPLGFSFIALLILYADGAPEDFTARAILAASIPAILAVVTGLTVAAFVPPIPRHVPLALGAILLMIGLFGLAFLIDASSLFLLWTGKLYASLLMVAIAVTLGCYLRSKYTAD